MTNQQLRDKLAKLYREHDILTEEEQFTEDVLVLLEEVVNSLKPTKLADNQLEHTHKVSTSSRLLRPTVFNVVTNSHSYNAAIEEIETKQKEIGLL